MIKNKKLTKVKLKSKAEAKQIIREIEEKKVTSGLLLYSNKAGKAKKRFFKNFKIIQAAGGLVFNEKDELLFIFRKGKWDLPKGKFNKKEEPEEAAAREVTEETGAQQLELLNELPQYTYHTYHQKGKQILKRTYWYKFRCHQTEHIRPETKEGITEVIWAPKDQWNKYLSNTYDSIRDLFE